MNGGVQEVGVKMREKNSKEVERMRDRKEKVERMRDRKEKVERMRDRIEELESSSMVDEEREREEWKVCGKKCGQLI
ncbi:hypothetical protein SOVF_063880 [Spinacia oleracea]|nr:hypothetical protein SOVF_063880 [Spinacia oleracea]